jgi:hypothetical protein
MNVFYIKFFITTLLSYCLTYTYEVLLNTAYLCYCINMDIILDTIYVIFYNVVLLYFIYFLNKYISSTYLNWFYYCIVFYIYYVYLNTLRYWFSLLKSILFSFIICIFNISGIDYLLNY